MVVMGNMDSAQRRKATTVTDPFLPLVFFFSLFLPRHNFLNFCTKRPVKFLTEGALYVFYLLCYDC